MIPAEAWRVLEESDLVCDADAVRWAIRQIAGEVTAALGDCHPLLLVVMHGGIYLAGQLLPLLDFPLDLDYVHVSRYGQGTTGGALEWRVAPSESVQGRMVLLLDDILDAGHTLAAVRERVLDAGAKSVHCAVLAEKQTSRPKPVAPDFIGLRLPDRYVFGCGMDIGGAWRNLPVIRAVRNS